MVRNGFRLRFDLRIGTGQPVRSPDWSSGAKSGRLASLLTTL